MREEIGPALRRARQHRGLSLRSVAGAVGVSASLLSQVETGKSQPSVSTLYGLVNHIGVSLDDLLGLERTAVTDPPATDADRPAGEQVVQRAADNPVLEMAGGVRWEKLAVGADPSVDALLVTYDPGAASSAERLLMRHGGVEYAYLLAGELTLLLEFDRHVVRAGDSLCFDSTRPHMYVNQGTVPARGVWFVSGRRELDHTRDLVTAQLGGPPPAHPRAPSDAVEALELLGSWPASTFVPSAQTRSSHDRPADHDPDQPT